MKITYFGTTTLLFDDGKNQILFDAHFSRPSFLKVGLGKLQTNTKLIDSLLLKHEMTRLSAIFISHSHHDHVMDMPYIAFKNKCEVYGSSSALNVARGLSIQEDRLHEFVCHKEIQIGDFRIIVIPSIHSKAHWYNNDLGQTIDSPLVQPAKKKAYKEGGSYDFIIHHLDKTYVIRPSFNYLENQFDTMNIDILFLGIGGLSKAKQQDIQCFFKETVEKLNPNLIIPIHWDYFFSSLESSKFMMPKLFDDSQKSLYRLTRYCEEHQIETLVQMPRTFIEIE